MTIPQFDPSCLLLNQDVCQRYLDLQNKLTQTLDPYGITTTLFKVQRAWAQHPQEAMAASQHLWREWLSLQQHSWKRALGLPSEDVVPTHPEDNRFSDPVWTDSAYWDIVKQWYLLYTHWLQDHLYETPGITEQDRRRGAFWMRKWLNAVAPTNFFAMNPVAQRKCIESRGQSLVDGMQLFLQDVRDGDISMTDKRPFKVGDNLATTPGQVVFRNRLLEVIQYAPTTDKVQAVPIVIVAPWINKYYILDLTSKKSLVKWLTDQGFTVFITSWKNPEAQMSDISFDDYIVDGIDQIVKVACSISKSKQVNLAGYCLGGTGVAIYMAWLAKKFAKPEDMPVASWTLFTTLTDFSHAGDIEVFIDEGGLEAIYRNIDQKGYLDGKEMASSFRMLRSNSLIWHYWVHNYLYGETPPAFDVLYWNVDTTRMPAKMHKYYLREFYLNNRLKQANALTIGGEKIDLGQIRVPLYAVGCEEDHIAPWAQTFHICNFVSGPARYTLSSSGHILGIVNPPVNPPKRKFWSADTQRDDTPESWRGRTQVEPGSWWDGWKAWLLPYSGEQVPPPALGNRSYRKLEAAPGSYVLEK